MKRRSIRARLTIWITVVTAALAFLAAWAAIEFMADEARSNAIDASERSIELAIEQQATAFDLPSEEQPQKVADVLAGLPVAEELFEQFADDDGMMLVEVAPTVLLATSGADATVEVGVPTHVLRLSWVDLAVLAGEAEPLGSLRATDDAELAFGMRKIGGVQYGLVADVTVELDDLVDLNITLWAAAAILTALAASTAWGVTGRALRPVEQTITEVDEIRSKGVAGRVAVPSGEDEIHRLAVTMNLMLDRLEQDQQLRRQFTSDASHELRTPVAILRSEAEAQLAAASGSDPDQLAKVVLAETARMADMVDDLLMLARADEELPSANVPGDVVDLDEIVLGEQHRRRSVDIDFTAVSAGRIVANRGDLARAVAHLLDNAARHASTVVSVGVRADGYQVQLWVEDDGPGVPKADRQKIFERFVRLDDARDRDRGGAGLGLAVTHAAVTSAGGSIEVKTGAKGGARFIASFPVAP